MAILIFSRLTPREWHSRFSRRGRHGAAEIETNQTIHVDGSALGGLLQSARLRTTKRFPLARMPAARFDTTRSQRRALRSQCTPNSASRPIAPGQGCRPLPPWDAAFPGAFFLRRPELIARENNSRIASGMEKSPLALSAPAPRPAENGRPRRPWRSRPRPLRSP
jgi:hypothetical protein